MARRTGTALRDILNGTAAPDEIFGLGGNDVLNGLGGNDEIFGGTGNDLINGGDGNDEMFGEAGNDTIDGGNGLDDLIGGAGNDVLNGGAGEDEIEGGLGRDIMTGGAAKTEYVYTSAADSRTGAANRDIINDFKFGIDDIDLRGIDARAGTAANDAFRFIGTGQFTGTAGQLRYQQFDQATGDFTLIQGDTNGDGVADFEIQLAGLIRLTSEEFNL